MSLELASYWLLTALGFCPMLLMLYVIGRTLKIGGGIVINPFQPGWGHLAARYRTDSPLPRMATASGRIGAVTHKDFLGVAYGPEEFFLQKNFFGTSCLRIPYRAIQLVEPPRRHTLLQIPIRTDGLFEVDGVRLCFPTDTARALLEEVVYATGGAPI